MALRMLLARVHGGGALSTAAPLSAAAQALALAGRRGHATTTAAGTTEAVATETTTASESKGTGGDESQQQRKPLKRRRQSFKQLKDFMPAPDGSVGSTPEMALGQGTVKQAFPPLAPSRLDGKRVLIQTYGCQMNVNDSELAWSILKEAGCEKATDVEEADIVLLVTCAIRENAETKVWTKLDQLSHIKRKRPKHKDLQIGVLGCMAERLKHKLVEESKCVDIVAGPDAYRELPTMLSRAAAGDTQVNVLLSLEETYADLTPVRHNPNSPSAFVSIQRGCDNMCSYCIVPFTRGRERSRPVSAILREVQQLSEQGVKEVTLLGQNVNSYLDHSQISVATAAPVVNTPGFKTIYKRKKDGITFAQLLEQVAQVDPEMRIRFTSPHPKDFPDEVLHVIRDHHNVCNQIHLPAQSGSDAVLDRMRRGYTHAAYCELVDRIHDLIPDVTLSSDFISGFCGETEADHLDTLRLLEYVKYDMAYLFAYSLREKTHAHRRLQDDVPEDVKLARLNDLIQLFHKHAKNNNAQRHGSVQTVLIESASKRSEDELVGRSDGNLKVIVPKTFTDARTAKQTTLRTGDYVLVEVNDSTSMSLRGTPMMLTSLVRSAEDTQYEQQLQQHLTPRASGAAPVQHHAM
ncbi:CDK5 regulatory subunit-associated protein 1 [Salpingoeca rosetta]|uniref:CDK5 regulatory subunit-associated protein 1 n=1 Tax=Salpingoeca rosetta (strain ATCC 50818 / BSB-021) TaxID=946362 RepID=F2TX33_SALR5|nr:CDK5 regulatory subunit-associated protein 1 [Salpingoeca rosetta]EGD75942.1 CDK5 regulatory subunit-associated protein 1 [Salpingoeca rosetta]|eukprot:XP_004998118.1 CDK5 regulatory subunit-associated protein 1 [Salpingoeca rosetta]